VVDLPVTPGGHRWRSEPAARATELRREISLGQVAGVAQFSGLDGADVGGVAQRGPSNARVGRGRREGRRHRPLRSVSVEPRGREFERRAGAGDLAPPGQWRRPICVWI
jgi:hypothetical protein